MVHGFVEEFVDAYEVVTDGFFLERAEIVFEYGG